MCSDIHSQLDRLDAVLTAMTQAGVEERWCLGDVVGGGPQSAQVLATVLDFELALAGNHDVWLLAERAWLVERAALSGRDRVKLSGLHPNGRRHDIDCWHGSPQDPLNEFFDGPVAARELPKRRPGSLGLVGHTHEPALFWADAHTVAGTVPEPGRPYPLADDQAVIANPGPVCGTRRDQAAWWLEVDLTARLLTWHRVRSTQFVGHGPSPIAAEEL